MLVPDDDAGHEPRVIAGMQAIREHAAVAANGDRAVGGLAHERGRAAQAAVLDAVLEDVEPALVVHGELRRDAAELLEREDLCEVLTREQGPMRIVGDPRRRGEAAIVVRHEDREEWLGGGRGGETPEAQLLDEAILERAVGGLDPALRLRAVGAETVDVEVAEGAAELRESRATLGAIAGHEAAGGVVDVDQQRAARATILEPGVLAAIELDELAEAGPALPRRIAPAGALGPRDPQAGGTHPAAQRLDGQDEGVLLGELLMGERGPEVGVALADEGQGALLGGGREPAGARTPAPARHEPRGAVLDERAIEASHLALADLEQPRRAPACQPPLGDPRQDLQAIQFLHAQREGSSHPGTVPEKRTSLLWRNRTFALGAYRGTSEFGRSVNFCASPEKGLYFGYLLALLLERLNTRPSRHLGQSRRDLFEAIERAALRPLPARPYELALWARPKVSIDYHIEFED